MIRHETNFADFLPRRLAWGIVIVAFLAIAIFVLPNLKSGAGAKKELDLADRNTFMQMLGMSKAEIQQKFGPPTKAGEKEWLYQLTTEPAADEVEVLRVEFGNADLCQRFEVIKQSQKLEVIEHLE